MRGRYLIINVNYTYFLCSIVILTIFYSPTLVAQQKERQIDEKLGTT